jgi:Fe-S cluster assembly protein SufB
MLAGVGAQYDSEVVYHNLRQELRDKGVVFEDMSVAVHEHAELVQKYFMKLIPANDHIFAALHGAVWSGGTFLYVPKGVEISDPLQAYFRMNVMREEDRVETTVEHSEMAAFFLRTGIRKEAW